MAAYYHGGAGTDIQSGTDGLQTLYLMNPSYAGYGDAAAAAAPGAAAANMMLLNSAVTSMTPVSFGHQPSPSSSSAAQHFVGIPLQPPASGYNLWTPAAATGAGDMSPPTPQHQHQQAHGGGGAAGVSAVLSLSSREAAPPVTVAALVAAGDEGKYLQAVQGAASQGQMVMSSKYLKAAQELLDEVVSVSKGVDDAKAAAAAAAAKSPASVKKKEDSEGVSGGGTEDGSGAKSGGAPPPPEMSTAERQELQMKKGKLINMLDEVEQRYRQYHQQMQVVVASFEAVAGGGSARTYTALALRTISRQFRCLRDAIAGQVRAASRALGEGDADGGCGGRTVGSRLRYIDHQLRQQRALQQLGMMQSSAWRPQRGLPERSVSILRAWLFEHFLHPYPKDSDKIMLAKQTGLTRSQVSNWFINARVRLWKPMVEEMYLEETKDQDGGGGAGAGDEGSRPGGSKGGAGGVNGGVVDSAAKMDSKAAHMESGGGGGVHPSLLELAGDHQAQAGFYDDDDEEDGGAAAALQQKLKKARTEEQQQVAFHVSDVATLHAHAAAAAAAAARHDEVSHRELLMKFMESGSAAARDEHHGGGGGGGSGVGYSLFAPAPYGQFATEQFAFAGHGGGGGGGGVSLTLGLPHGAEQTASFLMTSSNGSDGAGHVAGGGGGGGYDMNMQGTKSFAAQLMRDFVA
uniref:Homeobox domain-containing protein n=1 Tax=Oryza meridionalis TaxID=40149 RepID=A0A0E0F2S2_9ORYZ